MSAPVDVLAVMGADIARRELTAAALVEQKRPICERMNADRIADAQEARVAVAELIEKADNASRVLHNAILSGQIDIEYSGIHADLRAALARCKGEGK